MSPRSPSDPSQSGRTARAGRRAFGLLAGAIGVRVLSSRLRRARPLQSSGGPSASLVFVSAEPVGHPPGEDVAPVAPSLDAQRTSSPPTSARRRAQIDAALLALVAASVAVSIADAHATARLLLALVAACLVPGGSLLTRLAVDDLLSALGLAIALSLGIETVGALVMIWTGWWHPLAYAVVLGAGSCLLLGMDLLDSLARTGRPRR